MAMPDESSLFCGFCSVYNIQCGDCLIIDGVVVCDNCMSKFGLKKDFDKIKEKFASQRKKETEVENEK